MGKYKLWVADDTHYDRLLKKLTTFLENLDGLYIAHTLTVTGNGTDVATVVYMENMDEKIDRTNLGNSSGRNKRSRVSNLKTAANLPGVDEI